MSEFQNSRYVTLLIIQKKETSDGQALGWECGEKLKVMNNYIISTLTTPYYANPAGLT